MELWLAGDLIDSRYRVTRVLGRGGMGIVYQVRHLTWQTDLAVKRPRPEWFRTAADRELFTAEAQTWVSLGLHPNVCCCHYVQAIDGVPAVFAEYVPGGSLSDWIGDRRLQEGDALARILDIAIQAARGLEHAHRRGVIHLDVKPANILLDEGDTAKITDFGLARARAAVSDAAGSAAGDSAIGPGGGLMTRAYASPEQADGRPVGGRTDVYSLAVSVLEMVIGAVTWHSGTVAAAVLDARRSDMPPELAGLLERCLAYDPAGRPSMASVAAETARVYQSITGRRYVRPVPEAASLRADELNNHALSLLELGQPGAAREALRLALEADPRHLEATFNAGLLQWRGGQITDEDLIARLADAGGAVGDSGRVRRLLAEVHAERGDQHAAHAFGRNADRAPAGVQRDDHHRQPLPVRLSGDGRLAVTGGPDGGLRLWDPHTGTLVTRLTTADDRSPVQAADLTPDGRFAASASGAGCVCVWDCVRRRPTRRTAGEAVELRLTPGRVVVWALPTGQLRFWDAEGDQAVTTTDGHDEGAEGVEVSADGRLVLSSGWDNSRATVRLWDADGLSCLGILTAGDPAVTAMRVSQDAAVVVVGRADETIEVWDLRRRERIRVLCGGAASHLAVSGDARFLLAAAELDGVVRLWELDSGRLLRTFRDLRDPVDGVHINAGAAFTLTAREREPVRARQLLLPRAHASKPVLSRPRSPVELAELESRVETLTAAAREAMTASRYREALGLLTQARQSRGYARDPAVVSLWRELGRHVTQATVRAAWPTRTWRGQGSAVCSAEISSDGLVALSGDEDGAVRVWDTGTGTCLRVLTGHQDLAYSVALSTDGQLALSASRGQVRLWHATTGECLRVLPAYGLLDTVPARFADAGRAVVGGGDGLIHVWDLTDGNLVGVLRGHAGAVNDVQVSGGLVVSAGTDMTVRVWDARSGDCVHVMAGHQAPVTSVSLSADGTTVVSLAEGDIRVWDTASGRCLRRHAETRARTATIRLLADTRFLACAGRGRADTPHSMRVLDIVSGNPVLTIEATGAGATALAVSPDGGLALTAARDATMRLWHLDWELSWPRQEGAP